MGELTKEITKGVPWELMLADDLALTEESELEVRRAEEWKESELEVRRAEEWKESELEVRRAEEWKAAME